MKYVHNYEIGDEIKVISSNYSQWGAPINLITKITELDETDCWAIVRTPTQRVYIWLDCIEHTDPVKKVINRLIFREIE